MLKEGKFGIQEAVCLTTIAISSKAFFSSSAVLAGKIGNTGWQMVLFSGAASLLGFWFIEKLLGRFPGKDITEIFNLSLGAVLGFICSILLGLYMLTISAVRINELSEFLKVYVMPLSPIWFLTGIAAACIFILSLLGLEAIARVAKFLSLFLVIGTLTALIMGAQNYNINNLFPLGGHGFWKIPVTGLLRVSAFGEVIILAIFAKSLQGIDFIKREGRLSIILSALIISVTNIAISLTFPHFMAQEITAPMYDMVKLIGYGAFVQRIEVVFLFTWITSSLISINITFYSFVWIVAKAFKMPDKRPVIITSAIIFYAFSLMHRDITVIIFDYVGTIRLIGIFPIFILPILALVIAAARGKGERRNA